MTRAQVTSTVEQNNAGAGAPFVAGKNKIINGDMNIWQRGTSFTLSSGSSGFGADRWKTYVASGTFTITQQTFTPGSAPVSGYESAYFMRIAATNNNPYIYQYIEDVRILAGQNATISFWAKAASASNLQVDMYQIFGSNGSANVQVGLTNFSITTSWARYSVTYSVPSLSGKTIGTNNALLLEFGGAAASLDLWGVQVESGSVATPFTTATGTIQGELAACQRYYYRMNQLAITGGYYYGTTLCDFSISFPVTMRSAPTFDKSAASDFTAYSVSSGRTGSALVTNGTITPNIINLELTTAASTAGYVAVILSNTSNAWLSFTAEL